MFRRYNAGIGPNARALSRLLLRPQAEVELGRRVEVSEFASVDSEGHGVASVRSPEFYSLPVEYFGQPAFGSPILAGRLSGRGHRLHERPREP